MAEQKNVTKEWKDFYVSIPLPEGVSAEYSQNHLTVKGPQGEVTRRLKYPGVNVNVENGEISVGCDKVSRRERAITLTYRAHINNMIKGVTEGLEYKLRAVYEKFPVTLEVDGSTFRIKNFLGEKVPREMTIPEGVKVAVDGQDITLTGVDKETLGKVAGRMEGLTKINHLDRRVVQDGIYITEKPHKKYV